MDRDRLDHVLREATGPGRLPGLVAAVATADGVVYEGAAGVRRQGESTPMTLDTVFAIASMTKAVTGVAAMQCVQRGLLALDAPAGDVVPYLGRVQVLEGFDPDGQPVLRPPTAPVTLRTLLTHTSGFVYEIWDANQQRYLEVTGAPGLGSGLNAGLEAPLAFDPGSRWEYGIGIDWAGKLVEAVTGQRLGTYMAAEIFAPLGMVDTSFRPTTEQLTRRATTHVRTPEGIVAPPPSEPGPSGEYDAGGGGLSSTMPDYLRFARMVLGGGALDGRRIVRAETAAAMAANHIGTLDVQPLQTAAPALSNDCDFYPGMPQKWGLTYLINTRTTPEGRSPGSLAWAGIFNTYYWVDPAKGVAGVFAAQLLPFFDHEAMTAFRAFERAVNDGLG